MNTTEVKRAKDNEDVEYIAPIRLKDKVRVYSKALFLRIKTGETKKLSLKIGRYKKNYVNSPYIKSETLESETPKSELTLDPEELENLVKYIHSNYYPLSNDETHYLSLDEDTMSKLVKDNPDNVSKLIDVALKNDVDLRDINRLIEIKDRQKAIEEFKKNYNINAEEKVWQKWFQENSWVFGSDFVRILDDRRIDVSHISDFIVENIDGYVDVIEIKRPGDSNNFFEKLRDHSNLIPSLDLVRSITQLANYLSNLEKKLTI